MFDIHMHIIPGVDDGSRDMEMSGAMLEQAWSEGIRASPPRHIVMPSVSRKRSQSASPH